LLSGPGYTIGNTPGATITLHDNTPYNAAWAQQYPGFTGPNTNPLGDFNGNGIVNLLEFAFNGNPVIASVDGQNGGIPLLPVIGLGSYPDPNDNNTIKLYPTITFTRRTDAPQLIYAVETASTLLANPWDSTSALQVDVTTAGMPTGTERVTYRSGFPSSSFNSQFLRVRVTVAP
jgi:hypothetical protein